MLELNQVTAGYGSVPAIHGVTLTVAEGEVLAVLGANGAGKTTLARTISGQLPASDGTIRLRGADITRTPPHARARAGVIQVPEGRHLFGGLTVAENVALGSIPARRRGGDPEAVEAMVEAFPKLRQLWGRQAGLISGGEQQMVALVRAAAGRPRVLILDEPSLGLSPLLVEEVFAMVALMSRQLGCGVLLIEQMADRALRVADRGIVVARGRVTVSGTAEDLRRSEQLQAAYLGGQAPT